MLPAQVTSSGRRVTVSSRYKDSEVEAPLPTAPLNRIPNNINTLVCEACSGGYHEDKIVLCDRCDRGFHMFCLIPPLTQLPEGDWVCPHCK